MTRPDVRIDRIRAGITNTYLVRGRGAVLIDPGDPWRSRAVLAKLRTLGAPFDEIGMVLVSHGHFDHVGGCGRLRRAMAAPIAVHRGDAAWVRDGFVAIPPGFSRWGRTLALLTRCMMPLLRRVEAAAPDRVLTDADLPLTDQGVPGRIVHTPGHTPGSVSVLLDTGDAFVGDLATNGPPFSLRPCLFVGGDDLDQMRDSWRHLLSLGARTIHPGHGWPFPAEALALGRRSPRRGHPEARGRG